MSSDLAIFTHCFGSLAGTEQSAKDNRKKQWAHADPNGNGYLSLAEADSWILKRLMSYKKIDKDAANRIWKTFRPAYIRAFKDAADAMPDKIVAGTKTATTDDYVQRGEFHLLCSYLLIYVGLFDAFACIDGGSDGTTEEDDRRISPAEWTEHHSKLAEHSRRFVGLANIDESNQEAIFAAMDQDGKGMVLLKEWCEYLKGKEQEAGTSMGRVLSIGDDTPAPSGSNYCTDAERP
jgi:hypothetical protein